MATVIESLPSPPADPKGKWVHSSSPMEVAGKAKKSKGHSLPSDLVPSSNEVPVIEAEVETGVPLNLGGTTPISTDEAPEEREEGSAMLQRPKRGPTRLKHQWRSL